MKREKSYMFTKKGTSLLTQAAVWHLHALNQPKESKCQLVLIVLFLVKVLQTESTTHPKFDPTGVWTHDL